MIDYEALLHREVAPALGCTEPIAVAYTAAWAAKTLGAPVEKIHVLGSRNILKNAMSVGIPGSGMAGLPIAAALGALGGDVERGLEVLDGITQEQVAQGKQMIANGQITVAQKTNVEALYIEVTVSGGEHSATAIVRQKHTQLTELSRDGVVLLHQDVAATEKAADTLEGMTVQDIFQFCKTVPVESISFLMDGVQMNLRVGEEGLHGGYGMSVGHNLASGLNSQLLGSDIGSIAVATTAAACDARMAGAPLPVMSVAGSGNQGVVCTVPVAVFAQKSHASDELLLRAIALSDLITIHLKRGIGRLSALCGCGIAAAVGASCGILLILGGSERQIEYTIKNMAANITGMVCDGAKSGCAVKVATAVSAAVQCAVLAMNNVYTPSIDGIVDRNVEKTIANMGHVGRDGMAQADQVILDMMTAKIS
ncbi:MAG: L-serine ammonia-lyase, iron-sulfur-dependent, subunit alpha [Clostridia bacterium]